MGIFHISLLPLASYLALFFCIFWVLATRKILFSYLILNFGIVVGLFAGTVTITGLSILLITNLIIYTYYEYDLSLLQKTSLCLFVILIIELLYAHLLPGFRNWLLIDQLYLSADSYPYRQFLNTDKVAVGLYLLMFGSMLKRTLKDWINAFKSSLLPFLGLVVLLIPLSIALGYIQIDVKFPEITWFWVSFNLLCVVLIEEVFFRGFIQKELSYYLRNSSLGIYIAIGLASLLFALVHYRGGVLYVMLAFVAGIGYGIAYYRSQRLETSIIVHFLINLTHFLFFSYPGLKN